MFRRMAGAGDNPKHLMHVWVRVRGVLRGLVSTPVPRRCLSVRVCVRVRVCARWTLVHTQTRTHIHAHTDTHTTRTHACMCRTRRHTLTSRNRRTRTQLLEEIGRVLTWSQSSECLESRAQPLPVRRESCAREADSANAWLELRCTHAECVPAARGQCLARPWL